MRDVKIFSKEYLLQDFFKVEEAMLQFEKQSGGFTPTIRRLCFERGDSAAAVIWNSTEQRLIFVRQFRYPAHTKGEGWPTELVAGMISGEESAETCIKREVLEETGYQTESITHLSTVFTSPGGSSERIYLYFITVSNAGKVAKGGGLVDEHEDIEIIQEDFTTAMAAAKSGRVSDAKTSLGLLLSETNIKQLLNK